MVEEHFGDIEGVQPVYDDIIVAVKTEIEYDRALRKVLERARERKIKLNKNKIQYRLNKVSYMGEIVSKEGFTPDPHKVSAIFDMLAPQSKKDLQRLLGMINYLSKYISNMAELTAPLRTLLRKDVAWAWYPEHDAALAKLKSVLTSEPVLRFYDINLPTILQVDASKGGLGACLLQNDQPVAYASRAMTNAEQNYTQIEKELLAIVFGCERFDMYTYGADIDVITDHKPLESIFKKPLHKVPPCLQRMILRLQKYHVKVRYVPEKYLYVPHTLSRAYDKDNITQGNDMHDDMKHMIHCVVKDLPISDIKLAQLRQVTKEDQDTQILSKHIKEGWPQNKQNVPVQIRLFWNVRHDLHLIDGLVMKGQCLVIPLSWRPNILQQIHNGHFGIEKSKARARAAVYWPGISVAISGAAKAGGRDEWGEGGGVGVFDKEYPGQL